MSTRSFNILFYISLVAMGIVYCINMQLPILDIDSSQYALISKDMFHSGHYLEVYVKGVDYLDKPPLLFWTSCLSFWIFGIHDWAFRLPSVLSLVLGIYSCYRFAKLFYGDITGKLAALIMATCCASFLMTLDVRTDTMLTGWVMFSIWQLAEFDSTLKLKNIVWGAIGIGFAMLSKGPIGLIIPVTAFSVHFIYMRRWQSFFRWQYIIALLIIVLMLLPMSYGLYEQYDMHPGKKMEDGRIINSGLHFFYWTQSFGRITGENTWSNNPSTFFLLHSFLWSFSPWVALFLVALVIEVRNKIIEYNKPAKTEAISVAGFVLILIFFTRSKYQLPHYTFPIHPLAAILTAKYLGQYISQGVKTKTFAVGFGFHVFILVLMYALSFVILNLVFPVSLLYSVILAASAALFLFVITAKKMQIGNKLVWATMLPFITLSFVLSLNFYTNLLSYQSGSAAALYVNKIAPEGSQLLVWKDYAVNSMIFYSKLPAKEYIDEHSIGSHLVKDHTFIFADSAYAPAIEAVNPGIHIIKDYQNWAVTLLKPSFLNPKTRYSVTGKKVLLAY